MMFDRTVALPYGIYKMSVFAIFFSIAGQFGDLLESSIKRHFASRILEIYPWTWWCFGSF